MFLKDREKGGEGERERGSTVQDFDLSTQTHGARKSSSTRVCERCNYSEEMKSGKAEYWERGVRLSRLTSDSRGGR